MKNNSNRESIDQLIKHFWQNGYLTVSRKYGTYLPAPDPVGTYSIDAVGRYDRKYALGIVLSTQDLDDSSIFSKLNYLATRQTRFSNNKVMLFVGVDPLNLSKARLTVESLSEEAKKNIKLVVLSDSKASELPRKGQQGFNTGFLGR
ncbi:MAG: hypothetical protein HF314_13620 [Ignavibacteria bacterium]|jgi:hypothetical protein|nr:hypothetical protein [Ignavibacteria bacterium]MCU7504116.1 hypothetical protein [Ignavibacteria bacterium]MCU7516434.1 hypothetical protein [Ignavibacteria bacterium]